MINEVNEIQCICVSKYAHLKAVRTKSQPSLSYLQLQDFEKNNGNINLKILLNDQHTEKL